MQEQDPRHQSSDTITTEYLSTSPSEHKKIRKLEISLQRTEGSNRSLREYFLLELGEEDLDVDGYMGYKKFTEIYNINFLSHKLNKSKVYYYQHEFNSYKIWANDLKIGPKIAINGAIDVLVEMQKCRVCLMFRSEI